MCMVWYCGPTVSPYTAMWCCFLFQSLLVGCTWNNHGDWSGVIRIWQSSVTGSAPHPAIDSTVMTFSCKSLSVRLMPLWYNLMCVLHDQYNLMCVLYDRYNWMCDLYDQYNLMCMLYDQYNLICVLSDQYNLMCMLHDKYSST